MALLPVRSSQGWRPGPLTAHVNPMGGGVGRAPTPPPVKSRLLCRCVEAVIFLLWDSRFPDRSCLRALEGSGFFGPFVVRGLF